jgi:glutaredoxin-related protein
MTIEQMIKTIKSSRVVLFVNGSENERRCLKSTQIIKKFKKNRVMALTVDVSGDVSFIDALAKFTDIPQTPFLFVKGKPFGGFMEIDEGIETGELIDVIRS